MKLTVVMLNTHETRTKLVFENSFVPYGRRTVQIELTPEQLEQLKPRYVGTDNGKEVYEEIGEHWLEK